MERQDGKVDNYFLEEEFVWSKL